ncbi:adenylate/guanylate cyclase [Candidatus Moduliflexus flocculans]|uniref:Adenylate/guanylate cyclase n=1 Tax=Candidatus Moduliflexus flocculans TaxID=1499966 RepID=A0A081BR80_9BACT|nr:adenylate/guanylate cyclase [Candidatus Moduliflexus flocculans]
MTIKLPFQNKYITSLFLSLLALLTISLVNFLLPQQLYEWEEKTVDYRFRLRKPVPNYPNLVNIGIDDKSLDAIGVWPWDRSVHARMLNLLRQMNAAVIDYDLIFPRKSSQEGDAQFFEAVRQANNVILSTPFQLTEQPCFLPAEHADFLAKYPQIGHILEPVTMQQDGRICVDVDALPEERANLIEDEPYEKLIERDPFIFTGQEDRERVEAVLRRFQYPFKLTASGKMFHANRAVAPMVELSEAAIGMGHISASPDSDGIFRRVPLVIRVQDQLFPSLAFASVLRYLKVAPEQVEIVPGKYIWLRQAKYPERADLTDIRIPVDDRLQLRVNYPSNQTGYSYSDVLASENDPAAFESWKKEVEGRICSIGYYSTGTGDIGPTPLQTKYFLAFLHPAIMNTILTQNFFYEVGWWGNIGIAVVLLGAISLLFPKLSPLRFTLLMILIVLGYLFFANWLFQAYGAIINIFNPILFSLFLAYSLIIVYWYATEERERKHLRSAFKTYVSKQMLDQILKDPAALALSGTRKELSIMFSDVRKFSTLSDKIEPEVIHRLLNMYFSRMTNIAFKYDGFVDKFIGDGLLCFFGDPLPHPDHAMRAVMAATEMQKSVRELGSEIQEKLGLDPISIRIGINTGYVIVGNMGSAERMEYTVLGSDVNLAQRLEASATPGQVMISHKTHAHLGGAVPVRDMGEIQVKGFEKAVKVYELELPFE